ncbi:MAG: Flp pilus assembly protein CpaB [Pseudomonadota bacterium]
MNRARILVLGVAIVAGISAALMARNLGGEPEVVTEEAEQIPTVGVLVATGEIEAGKILEPGDFDWNEWPERNVGSLTITEDQRPDAINEFDGAIARTRIFRGEPILEGKLAIAGPGGFLSAGLASGMRAVATVISEETGAGGFILPNDRVDVILTRREPDPTNPSEEIFVTETVLENVRVLAIDQTIEEEGDTKDIVGDVATLELEPRQAEVLALAEQLGDLSLALRSILDGDPEVNRPTAAEHLLRGGGRRGGDVTVVRYGISTQTQSAP